MFQLVILFVSLLSPFYFIALTYERAAYVEAIYYVSLYLYADEFHYLDASPDVIRSEQMDQPVILCLHGQGSYPSTFIPFINSMRSHEKTKDLAIYAMQFNYDDEVSMGINEGEWIPFPLCSEYTILKNQITAIKEQFDRQGKPLKIILVGHSRGATTSAYYAYCLRDLVPDVEILGIISFGGRLSSAEPCHWFLKQQLEEIEAMSHEDIPIYSLFGDYDNYIPRSALDVTTADKTFNSPYLGHLGILFDPEAMDFIHAVPMQTLLNVSVD